MFFWYTGLLSVLLLVWKVSGLRLPLLRVFAGNWSSLPAIAGQQLAAVSLMTARVVKGPSRGQGTLYQYKTQKGHQCLKSTYHSLSGSQLGSKWQYLSKGTWPVKMVGKTARTSAWLLREAPHCKRLLSVIYGLINSFLFFCPISVFIVTVTIKEAEFSV